MPEKKIIYNGSCFILGTAGKYYYATIKQKSVALHRKVWMDRHGLIPKGCHIHHKDGNVFNNSIENLECISSKEHHALHWSKDKGKRMLYLLKLAETGREYAKEWHGSHTGKKWHKQHYEDCKNKLHVIYDRKCSTCGKPIQTERKEGNCFCCGYCKTKHRYLSGVDNEIRYCLKCNQPFEVNKYRKVVYCSIRCKPVPNPKGRRRKS